MSPVDFLGIHFRSTLHAYWFKSSMGMFATGILWFLLTAFILKNRVSFLSVPTLLFLAFAIGHIRATIDAIIVTRGGKVNGNEYSKDCIWFNALMAVVNFGLALLIPLCY